MGEHAPTPGPWQIVESQQPNIIGPGGEWIATTTFCWIDLRQIEANTRLVAAAPDCHEAAKASLTVLCAIRDAQSWSANMLKDIDFAIEACRVAVAKVSTPAPSATGSSEGGK